MASCLIQNKILNPYHTPKTLHDLALDYLFNFIPYHSPNPVSLYTLSSLLTALFLLMVHNTPHVIKACTCQDGLRYAVVTNNLQISEA